jgi:hypothetical protein
MDGLTPAQWLASVADVDERPNVRTIAAETLARLRHLEAIEARVIEMRDSTRPVGNRPVGPAHRTACYLLGEGG